MASGHRPKVDRREAKWHEPHPFRRPPLRILNGTWQNTTPVLRPIRRYNAAFPAVRTNRHARFPADSPSAAPHCKNGSRRDRRVHATPAPPLSHSRSSLSRQPGQRTNGRQAPRFEARLGRDQPVFLPAQRGSVHHHRVLRVAPSRQQRARFDLEHRRRARRRPCRPLERPSIRFRDRRDHRGTERPVRERPAVERLHPLHLLI